MSLRLLFALTLSSAFAYGQPTYAREVSRIVQGKCQQCHRPNDIAPMAFSTYDQLVDWAPDIKRVVNEGIMPPWKPVAGHGKFRDAFGLTAQEKQDLIAWIDGGTPMGDEADMPDPLADRGEWALGDPDKVVKMTEPFTPLRGRDTYRCFVIDPQLTEDKYVSAVDVLPGNRKSVHHVILYLDSSGKAEQLDAADEGPGYSCLGGPGTFDFSLNSLTDTDALNVTLGGWAPGARPHHLPTGVGMFLPKKAKIVMQVHYYTNVSLDADQTRLGLYYAPGNVERRLFFLPLAQTNLAIPAGDPAHQARPLQFPIFPGIQGKVINVFPHMHLLGTDIKVEATRLGKTETLIWIDKWDFNWQGSYTYEEPVTIPVGTTLSLSCTYDNSANNPRNPSNPPKTVRWGEQTTDEMCVGFLGVTLDQQSALGLRPLK